MERKVEMRKIFCDTLIDLAKADERILYDAQGFGSIDDFSGV